MKARIFDISGIVYRDIGEYNQAKELHIKALMINQKTFSEDPASVATSYDNLASVRNSLGECVQAKEFHEKALTIYKKTFGEDHGSVATSYNNLSLVYFCSNKLWQPSISVQLYGRIRSSQRTSRKSTYDLPKKFR